MRNNIWGEGERERGIGRNCKKDSVQNISFKKKKNWRRRRRKSSTHTNGAMPQRAEYYCQEYN